MKRFLRRLDLAIWSYPGETFFAVLLFTTIAVIAVILVVNFIRILSGGA